MAIKIAGTTVIDDSRNLTNITNINGTSVSDYATEGYVDDAITDLVDSSPATLDTLNELAAALGDDPNFATTVSTNIGGKVSKSGDTMSGTLVVGQIDSGNPAAGTDDIRVSGYGILGNRGTFYITNPGTVQIGVGSIHNNDSAMTFTSSQNTSLKTLYENSNRVFTDGYHPNADAWTTARTLSLTGDVTGSVSWDGSANVSLSVTVANDSHTHDTLYMRRDTPSLTSNINTIASKSEVVRWNNATTGRPASGQTNEYGPLLQMAYNGDVVSQLAHDFDQDNLYFRNLTTSSDTVTTWKRLFHDDYHPNADKWTTARTLTLSGDASGSTSWDGSGNASISVTVADDSHDHTGMLPRSELPSGVNLNSYRTSGYRSQNVNSEAASGSNYPVDFAGMLEIVNDDTGNGLHTLQRYHRYNTADHYTRYYYNGSWTGWARNWNSLNDGSGSGLDADLLDGQHGSYYYSVANPPPTYSKYLRSDVSDVYDGRVLEFGTAGNGQNTSGAFLTIEGNTDSSGEGSGRLFFREHNSTTAGADNYGMSLGYRGGSTSVTTARGNTWTGLTGIGNGEWGMWGHDNSQTGVLAMHGPRDGSYVDFNNAKIAGNQVWHAGNDGSGSGLDADLLDGKESTNFGATLATYGTTSSSSGRIRCTAPFATNSGHMFQVTVSLYSSYQAHEYIVSGYMYSTLNNWYSPTVIYKGTGSSTPDIIVGRDSNGKAYISIANGGYTGVRVHNMTRGYNTTVADTYDPWTITVDAGTENSLTPGISKVWTSGNDGSGSGLDADLLDGQQGSYYYPASNPNGYTTYTANQPLDITSNAIFNNVYIASQILHSGDTNTYMQFHAADQWRVVTGGAERLEVNNSAITSQEPIYAPSFHGDGSSLTGIASGANDDIFWENGQTVTSNYTITNGKNAMSAGPITINSGVTVTVGDGETWTVI